MKPSSQTKGLTKLQNRGKCWTSSMFYAFGSRENSVRLRLACAASGAFMQRDLGDKQTNGKHASQRAHVTKIVTYIFLFSLL